MRRFLFVIIFFLAVAVVVASFGELEKSLETLQRANIWFFLLAVLTQLLWLYNAALTYKALYKIMRLEDKALRLLPVAASAEFINVVAPSAGIGGVAVFVNDARQRGHPPGKVMIAGILHLLFDYAAFLCVLALGIVVLIRRNDLDTGEIVASLILLSIAAALSTLIYLGSRSAEALEKALVKVIRFVNRLLRPILRRDYLNRDWAREFAAEAAEGLATLRGRTRELVTPMLLSLNSKALLICVLMLVFLAFRVPFSAGTLVGGFSIGYLFLIVSPTPYGIGIVEGVLPVVFRSLRVSWENAVIVTLVYRFVTFWLPFGIGGVAFRWLQARRV